MPKETNPSALIAEFGGSKVWWTYNATTKALFCQLCMISIDIKKKSSIKQHVSTEKHKRGIERETKGEARQQHLWTSVVKRLSFTTDLAKMMEVPGAAYCKQPVPGRNPLTKVIEEETKEHLQNIKAKLSGKDLCIQVDETTDRQGRSMTAILASPLDGQSLDRPFMIDCVDIITANNVTLQQAVIKSLSKLFGDEVDFNKLRVFLTDGAPYCIKAGLGLKSLCPNMLHITCLAHGVNRVAELARVTYPKANRLISEGTWLKAAFYYTENFAIIKQFIEGMKEDAQSIIEAKKLFKDEEVMAQLTIIRANFQVVVHTITSLEERLPLVQSMQLVENLVEKLKLEPFATKLVDVLSKNPRYAKAQKISKLLRGSQEDHEGLDDPNSSANMGNCPIVTCDVGSITEAGLAELLSFKDCSQLRLQEISYNQAARAGTLRSAAQTSFAWRTSQGAPN
eukprot:snap_masked-scaffold23_size669530-processed-gene-1.11 protein:Tk11054 transcript:snap_masked-scaffold23_size669530-processed-gene-1.11-mRNA-1 annotation:"PREDICTED: uncharacterized protein LOC100897935"